MALTWAIHTTITDLIVTIFFAAKHLVNYSQNALKFEWLPLALPVFACPRIMYYFGNVKAPRACLCVVQVWIVHIVAEKVQSVATLDWPSTNVLIYENVCLPQRRRLLVTFQNDYIPVKRAARRAMPGESRDHAHGPRLALTDYDFNVILKSND